MKSDSTLPVLNLKIGRPSGVCSKVRLMAHLCLYQTGQMLIVDCLGSRQEAVELEPPAYNGFPFVDEEITVDKRKVVVFRCGFMGLNFIIDPVDVPFHEFMTCDSPVVFGHTTITESHVTRSIGVDLNDLD